MDSNQLQAVKELAAAKELAVANELAAVIELSAAKELAFSKELAAAKALAAVNEPVASKKSLGYFAGMLLLLVGVAGYLVWKVFKTDNGMPELLMGLFVVTAIGALMTLLYLLAAGFNFMKLTDVRQPLGLPDGSIRAMIALILIIAFIIFGFYLYRSVGDGVSTVLEKNISSDSLRNVNMNRYKDLQTQIIMELKDKTDSNGNSIGNSKDSIYTIQSIQKVSEEGSKLAQQLLTTVGTLVVAISSFYFGSNTVSSAMAKAAETTPSSGTTPAPGTDPAPAPAPEPAPKPKPEPEPEPAPAPFPSSI